MPSALARSKRTSIHWERTTTNVCAARVGIASKSAHSCIRWHHRSWSSLINKEHPFIPPEVKLYFQDLIGTNVRLWNILESQKETIEALEGTNNSLLSYKLSNTMKVLTIFSAIALPMSIYTNLLAMTANIPFGHIPSAFWIHTAITLVFGLITAIFFRLKRL
jgi:Mg2+ and Co2+ transporter CorA